MTGQALDVTNSGNEQITFSENVRTKLIAPLLEQFDALDKVEHKGALSGSELDTDKNSIDNPHLKKSMDVASEFLPEIQVISDDQTFSEKGISRDDLSGLGELADQMKVDVVLAQRIKEYAMKNFDKFNTDGNELLTRGEVAAFSNKIAEVDKPIHSQLFHHIADAGSRNDVMVAPGAGMMGYHAMLNQRGATRSELQLYPNKVANSDKFSLISRIGAELNN